MIFRDYKSSFLWKDTILSENSTIKNVIDNLNNSGLKISLVVNKKNKFVGTITDGDIRRGISEGLNLKSKITKIINKNAIVIKKKLNKKKITTLLNKNLINALPRINKYNQVVDLHTTFDLPIEIKNRITNKVIIMAGGMGKRMMPHTKKIPKPLIRIKNKPMIEHVILNFKKFGFINFILSLNYLGRLIKNHYKDGKKLGIKIDYIEENKRLGTAGSLSLLNSSKNENIIVTNCDVISEIDYSEVLKFHNENSADATMVVRHYEIPNPFAVIKTNGRKFISFKEKPSRFENINAGIYVLKTTSLKYLKYNEKIDMPDFFMKLKKKNKKVVVYPSYENWADLGTVEMIKKLK